MSDKAIHGRCQQCYAPIDQPARGRTRLYCSDACRKAAQREREASWTWLEDNAPQRAPGRLAGEGLASLEDLYESEHSGRVPAPDGSTVDDVMATILAAAAVVAELRRHSVAAAPKLAARCEQVASALDAALAAEFGDVLKSDCGVSSFRPAGLNR